MPGHLLRPTINASSRKGKGMQKYVLVFDGDCVSCSSLARTVQQLAVPDLGVLSLHDPLLAQALPQVPDRPGLLVNDTARARLLYGWAMRRQLASIVGWRNARTLTRLLIGEWRARLAKTGDPTRRGVLKTGVAGAAALVLLPRGTRHASLGTTEVTPSTTPATAADVRRAMESQPMHRAIRTFGPVRAGATEVTSGTERVLVFSHNSGEFTFIDNSADATPGDPAAITIGKAPGTQNALRYYTTSGVALADLVLGNGTAKFVPLASNDTSVKPDVFSPSCWLYCMQAEGITNYCGAQCISCFDGSGGITACAYCTVCAGPLALKCAKQCS
jgi:hypothetical protein